MKHAEPINTAATRRTRACSQFRVGISLRDCLGALTILGTLRAPRPSFIGIRPPPQYAFDDHHVPPLAVEPGVLLVDPNLLEAY